MGKAIKDWFRRAGLKLFSGPRSNPSIFCSLKTSDYLAMLFHVKT